MHPAIYCAAGICYLIKSAKRNPAITTDVPSTHPVRRRGRRRPVALAQAGDGRGPAPPSPGGPPPPTGMPVPDVDEFDPQFCHVIPAEKCPPHMKLLGHTPEGYSLCCFTTDCVVQQSAGFCYDAPPCPDGYVARAAVGGFCPEDGSAYTARVTCCPGSEPPGPAPFAGSATGGAPPSPAGSLRRQWGFAAAPGASVSVPTG